MSVGAFSGLHARAFSHETEDLARVERAMRNVLELDAIRMKRTEGVHGNSIYVLEAATDNPDHIESFFRRLTEDDLKAIIESGPDRIDDDCTLHLRLDKQEAFRGQLKIARHDDVISVRVKIKSFPAKRERAVKIAVEHLTSLIDKMR